jgi:hypothetical protein
LNNSAILVEKTWIALFLFDKAIVRLKGIVYNDFGVVVLQHY